MRRNKKLTVMLVLVILLMCLTVGYAVLSTNLNINGTSTINNARWNIHFEHVVPQAGIVTPTTAATINATGNTVSYAVTLEKPGDYYEFTVDVRNAGTIDGMIESVSSKLNGVEITNLPPYLEYYVTYSDGIEIANNHLLAANNIETYKVHVGYKKDLTASDLPDTAQNLTMSFGVSYTQATTDAKVKPYYAYTLNSSTSLHASEMTLYDNYSDIMNITNHPFFIKVLVDGNEITDTELGIFYGNKANYLKAYSHSTTEYNDNIARALSFFGDKCTNQGSYYSCYEEPFDVHISNDVITVLHDTIGSICESVSLTEGGYVNCRS